MADEGSERKAEDSSVVEATADEVRQVFGQFLNRAGFGRERIVIVRHGKQVAALVGIADLERLRSLDGRAA